MRMLTVSEVASIMGVCPKKVRELIHARQLQAENISPGAGRKTWRIDPTELNAFRERQRVVSHREVQRRRILSGNDVIEFVK